VIPLTHAIPEHIKSGYDDALYKWTFTLLYSTVISKDTSNNYYKT